MRTRDKQRIFKRFMAGEGVCDIWRDYLRKGNRLSALSIESILREGLAGKLDAPRKSGKGDWLNTGWRWRGQ